LEQQGLARLESLIESHFTCEGIHLEHSPDYHKQMLDVFEGLISSKVVKDEKIETLRRPLEEGLSWFILPNGRLATFGDSLPIDMTSSRYIHETKASLKLAARRGDNGDHPTEPLKAFPESGYAVVR